MLKHIFRSHPGRVALLALIGAIVVGTGLLALPWSRTVPVSFVDLFFTATSALCVCGLTTIPMTSFTSFGQLIILILMQIGGLGLMTLSLIFIALIVDVGLSTKQVVGQLFELQSFADIRPILTFVISLTIGAELLGALGIWLTSTSPLGVAPWFYAIFQAVSAFCNAGISLTPASMVPHNNNIPLLLITAALIIAGGIGFITWYELVHWTYRRIMGVHARISLHTRIALTMTGYLIVLSMLLFWMLERHHGLLTMSPTVSAANVLFNAISMKSTGFITIPIESLRVATLFLIMIFAFVGSSPGSAGSGIKVTVLAIFFASARAIMMGQHSVHIAGRRIPRGQVYKSLVIITMSVALLCAIIFALLIIEPQHPFLMIVFEAVSSFSNLGLSTGLTPHLSTLSKSILSIAMIIGRIGVLSLVVSLAKHRHIKEVSYPEESVILG